MAQLPQWFGSELVSTQAEPHAVWPAGQLTLPPELPPVPGLPTVEGLLHAAAKIAKKRPKRTLPVFITVEIPGFAERDLPGGKN